MSAHAHMDRFGRVLIPKAIWDALDLWAGTTLEIVVAKGTTHLYPTTRSAQLIEYAGRLSLSAPGRITVDPVQDLLAVCLEEATDKW